MNTLEKLNELRNFIQKNPTTASILWHKKLSIRFVEAKKLKENGIVKNIGSNSKPNWTWAGPLPNLEMSKRLNGEIKRAYVSKPTNFWDVLSGVSFKISDGVTAKVNKDRAVIYKGDFSMTIKEPEVFRDIMKLIQ